MHNKLRTQNLKLRTIDRIVAKTKKDLEKRKQYVPLDTLKKSINKQYVRSFIDAIRNPRKGNVAIIAEVKFASPTETQLGLPKGLLSRVKEYEQAGADCVSVVTERHFFKGDPEFVNLIKNTISLPVLQKDFIIDAYQVYEAKKAGADAILLIAKIVSSKKLAELVGKANELGLEPVVEVQTEEELADALTTDTNIIAVNARDLDSLEVDVDRACELLKMIPDKYIKLGFSGVIGKVEVEKYKQAGANGVLVGTSLMKAGNIGEFIRRVQSI